MNSSGVELVRLERGGALSVRQCCKPRRFGLQLKEKRLEAAHSPPVSTTLMRNRSIQ